ncbi:T9SS type B sorting domain-containing protein [Flavobacterium suzhouense]|uniref:T9SS type B sorting domain-containing protein n=1 Tax=Flavobacterium suzhouense TaxID=1529638 RepID=A0ABW5NPL6_9FLAO
MKTALKSLFLILLFNIISGKAQQVEWAKVINGQEHQSARAVDVDDQGNIYLSGITSSQITDLDPGSGIFNLTHNGEIYRDEFLVKLDSNGNFLWGKGLYPDAFQYSNPITMKIGPDGYIYTMSSINIYENFSQTATFINKFDSNGNLILTKIIKNHQNNQGHFLGVNFDIDISGNIYINGNYLNPVILDPQNPQFNINNTGGGAYILKLNNNGEIVWNKVIPNDNTLQTAIVSKVAVQSGDDLIYGLRTLVQNQTQTGYIPLQKLYKIDGDDGVTIWEKSFLNQELNDLAIAPNGEIVISSNFTNVDIDVDPSTGIHMLIPGENYDNQYILWLSSEGEFIHVIPYLFQYEGFLTRSINIDENYNCFLNATMEQEGPYDIDPSNNEFFVNTPYSFERSVIIRFDENYDFVTGYTFGNIGDFYIYQTKSKQDKLYFAGTYGSNTDIQPGPEEYFLEQDDWYVEYDAYIFVLTDCVLTAPNGEIDQYFCSDKNPKISDLKPNTQNISWYENATSVIPLEASTPIIDGQVYYAARITNCGIPDRLAVTAYISAAPAAPIAANQQFCSVTNPTVANLSATGTEIKWYTDNTNTNYLESNAPLTNGQYYASQTTHGCESQRTAITVSLITTSPPTAAASQAFCINSNATVSNLASTGTDVKIYDSITSTTPLDNITALQNQTYYATQTLNGCESDRVPIAVTINTPPAPTAFPTQIFCAGDSPVISNLIVAGTNIKWYNTATEGDLLSVNTTLADNTTYYASQTIDGCESLTRCIVSVTIDNANIPAQNYETIFCDANNDGREIVNLSDYNSYLSTNTIGYDFSYYYSENGAENKLTIDRVDTPIALPISTGITTIFARIESPGGCSKIVSLKLELAQQTPFILSESEYYICQGNNLTISPNHGFSNFNWSNGSTRSTFTINQPGNYAVTADYDHGTIKCKATFNFTVIALPETHITEILTSDWTDDDNSITIIASSGNNNEFSIDGIHYQYDNHFNNLTPGIYTVHARDVNGCGYDTSEVLLLNYPKFFTPNNDGVNDYWKIDKSFFENDLTVIIFDRYGKVIKAFKNNESGWDGTLDNKPLPATDYWFVVKREGKEYKGHFSLIR